MKCDTEEYGEYSWGMEREFTAEKGTLCGKMEQRGGCRLTLTVPSERMRYARGRNEATNGSGTETGGRGGEQTR
jgi:hypothetical protein